MGTGSQGSCISQLGVALVAASLAPHVAGADPSITPWAHHSSSNVHVDVGAGTHFPLSLDAEGTVELPGRLLLQGSIGWMPSAYSGTVIDVLGDFGGMNPYEQQIVKSALQSSLVARIAGGWRPFAPLGLELLFGYTLFAAGGSVTEADVIDSFLAASGSSDRIGGLANQSVPLSAVLHNFEANIGWRVLFFDDHIVARASVGYLQCFGSVTSVNPTIAAGTAQAALTKVSSELQGLLNPYFTEYVKTPVAGFTLSYRF